MLSRSIQALGLAHAPCWALSMGMSNDYAIAIEEGSDPSFDLAAYLLEARNDHVPTQKENSEQTEATIDFDDLEFYLIHDATKIYDYAEKIMQRDAARLQFHRLFDHAKPTRSCCF
ncbi:MAG: hypothetical protein MZU97_25270 [Bacillus subtilis]|nr:hypothetical protein [Bacillus subtilis]